MFEKVLIGFFFLTFLDELCSTLMKERQRNTDLQQEVVKLSQTCSSMCEIQAELNDAKVNYWFLSVGKFHGICFF